MIGVKLSLFTVIFISSASLYGKPADPKPTLEIGSVVFKTRCILCHGKEGMGEGILPLKIKNYPNTNLYSSVKARTRDEIHDVVVYGSKAKNISIYMPPMGNELTWTEVESVVMFVELMRKDLDSARTYLAKAASPMTATKKLGKQLFDSRCTLCHGSFGEGNGRMAKVIKHPPPANLVTSRLPDSYLRSIIKGGGEPLKRSAQMPPWGDQFNDVELDALIIYLKSIRD